MPAVIPTDPLYSVVSFTPAASKGLLGNAVIQVNGCTLQTSIDIPFGTSQGGAIWNSLVDPIVASIVANMDPNGPTYDPSLVAT